MNLVCLFLGITAAGLIGYIFGVVYGRKSMLAEINDVFISMKESILDAMNSQKEHTL